MVRPVVTGCAQSDYPRQIYDGATWVMLQDSYFGFDEDDDDASSESLHEPHSGFLVPYEVWKTPEKGRGVFVTSPVKRGEQIWRNDHHGEFRKESHFRRFLERLPFELQCDILLWAYVERSESSPSGFIVSLDLDEGSFINHGETAAEINLGNDDRATRDIEAGEQLLMNYTKFIVYDALPWFDGIRAEAWREDKSAIVHSTVEYNNLGRLTKKSEGLLPDIATTVMVFVALGFMSMMRIHHWRSFFARKSRTK